MSIPYIFITPSIPDSIMMPSVLGKSSIVTGGLLPPALFPVSPCRLPMGLLLTARVNLVVVVGLLAGRMLPLCAGFIVVLAPGVLERVPGRLVVSALLVAPLVLGVATGLAELVEVAAVLVLVVVALVGVVLELLAPLVVVVLVLVLVLLLVVGLAVLVVEGLVLAVFLCNGDREIIRSSKIKFAFVSYLEFTSH